MEDNLYYPLKLNQVEQICNDTIACFRKHYSRVLGKEDIEIMIREIELITGEACTNSIRHCNVPSKNQLVVTLRAKKTRFEIIVTDPNPEYDFYKVPEPDLKNHPESGYGIYIIRLLSDGVTYRREKSRNILKIVKNIEPR